MSNGSSSNAPSNDQQHHFRCKHHNRHHHHHHLSHSGGGGGGSCSSYSGQTTTRTVVSNPSLSSRPSHRSTDHQLRLSAASSHSTMRRSATSDIKEQVQQIQTITPVQTLPPTQKKSDFDASRQFAQIRQVQGDTGSISGISDITDLSHMPSIVNTEWVKSLSGLLPSSAIRSAMSSKPTAAPSPVPHRSNGRNGVNHLSSSSPSSSIVVPGFIHPTFQTATPSGSVMKEQWVPTNR